MAEAERILVPTDFSPMSKHALRQALGMVRTCGGELHLIHVIPDFRAQYAFNIPLGSGAELEVAGQAWAAKEFTDYLRGEELEGLHYRTAVRFGDPPREICAYADGIGAALIVIASHGRSGFERAMFGSVAEKVLRLCVQPVLVVKALSPPTPADGVG